MNDPVYLCKYLFALQGFTAHLAIVEAGLEAETFGKGPVADKALEFLREAIDHLYNCEEQLQSLADAGRPEPHRDN